MTNPTPQPVQFATLAHHLEEQVRGSTDPATVKRYSRAMREGEEFPPLRVVEVAGALVLVDGFHRRDAAEALGWEALPAEIVPCSSLNKARWLGFEANFRHGKSLKAKHFRPALNAFIAAGLERKAHGRLLSYRELAAELPGLSYSTIRRWIKEDHPKLFREMGDGEGNAPGGLSDTPPALTPEESLVETARAFVADAAALLRGLRLRRDGERRTMWRPS